MFHVIFLKQFVKLLKSDNVKFATTSPVWVVLFSELNKNPVEGFSAGLIDDNDIYRWEVLIIGPPDTL